MLFFRTTKILKPKKKTQAKNLIPVPARTELVFRAGTREWFGVAKCFAGTRLIRQRQMNSRFFKKRENFSHRSHRFHRFYGGIRISQGEVASYRRVLFCAFPRERAFREALLRLSRSRKLSTFFIHSLRD